MNKIFEMRAESFLAGMKVNLHEGDGRILLGNRTDPITVMMQPIKFQCIGVRLSARLPCIYVYSL
jgi:hypothetical protein